MRRIHLIFFPFFFSVDHTSIDDALLLGQGLNTCVALTILRVSGTLLWSIDACDTCHPCCTASGMHVSAELLSALLQHIRWRPCLKTLTISSLFAHNDILSTLAHIAAHSPMLDHLR